MLNDLLGGLPPAVVLAVVAALVTAEAALVAGLVLPAATALVAMGLLANAGVVPVAPAFAVAIGAAALGGNLAFWSGARRAARGDSVARPSAAPPSPAVPSSPGVPSSAAAPSSPAGGLRSGGARGGFRAAGQRGWQRAERLFARHGGRAIFLGQWVVGARTLMPRLAARGRVPHRTFLAWHTPAAILWAVWMVGASYAAGASYDVLAARAGRAAGALAAICVIILGLILAGRWFGQNPDFVRAIAHSLAFRGRRWPRPAHPVIAAGLSLGLLTALAALLVAVIPPVVRFSGLEATDDVVAEWARSQWTSDGYLFALRTATTFAPEALIFCAVLVSLVRWFWPRLVLPSSPRAALTTLVSRLLAPRPSPRLSPRSLLPRLSPRSLLPRSFSPRSGWAGLLEALGPVLPALILAGTLSAAVPHGWRAAETLVFPSPAEFDGPVPVDAAAVALATMSAGQTAQVAAAAGLLAWLVARGLPWSWQAAVWTAAAIGTVICAGCWVYLGWSRISETVAAVVLGAAWAAVNAAVWSGRRAGESRAPTAELVHSGV